MTGLITVAEIQAQAAAYFGLSLTDMKSSEHRRSVARPRQVAMYLARRTTDHSFPTIGRLFGGKDHTTVMHACRAVEALIESDIVFAVQVEQLRLQLARNREERAAV